MTTVGMYYIVTKSSLSIALLLLSEIIINLGIMLGKMFKGIKFTKER